jgi:hypothetical protein
MSQIVIRNIGPAVIAALRRRRRRLRHLDRGAGRGLAQAVGLDQEAAARRLAEIRRITGSFEGPSTLDDLRRDRDRDQE